MANYKVTDTELASIANAIRTKGGTSAQLEFPEEFVSAIEDISSSGGIGSYAKGILVGEYDNRAPSAGGVGGAWTSTGHDTSDDIGYIVDYYYNDNLIKSTLILKDKLLPNAAPNHAFENLGVELAANGGLNTPAGFNVKIENSIMIVSFGAAGNNKYSAKVYTAVHSGGGGNVETASIFRWKIGNPTTCWGIMKKLSGDVIGQNGDNANSSISLAGDLMTATFHGTSQAIEVVANTAIKLKAYKTGRTLGTATMTEYTMAANAQQNFTTDNLYGGLYLEASQT